MYSEIEASIGRSLKKAKGEKEEEEEKKKLCMAFWGKAKMIVGQSLVKLTNGFKPQLNWL